METDRTFERPSTEGGYRGDSGEAARAVDPSGGRLRHAGGAPSPAPFPQGSSGSGVPEPGLPSWLVSVFAAGAGVIVLDLFAAQPLVGLIAPSLGLAGWLSTLVATAPLLGYATGLILLTPLADIVENRKLVLWTVAADAVACCAAAFAPSAPMFFAASLSMGVATSAIQMLVPFAAALAPEHARGRAVGNVMAGLMTGIMLSRPVAALIADSVGWRGTYATFAVLLAAVALLMAGTLPSRQPPGKGSYPALISSMWRIVREEPVLRGRATAAALCFGAFSCFWTVVALRLAEPPFGLDARGVALFALAGAGGAVIAPVAGRLGDSGLSRPATVASHIAIAVAVLLALAAGGYGTEPPPLGRGCSVLLLACAAFLLDVGVIGDQALGRRAINLIRPEARGRVNGLFTGAFFLSGAAGGTLGGAAWASGGWAAACLAGLCFAAAALLTDVAGHVGPGIR